MAVSEAVVAVEAGRADVGLDAGIVPAEAPVVEALGLSWVGEAWAPSLEGVPLVCLG